ncbi:16S rRNA (guanine(527)-N(7))-methyltransferase RsmG [Denitratisoma oestradiolicum]|uniref:Ribosomal RNA small subunit methyltransferase G n=1 Tax=Denitratisoma oestradiolicum TaxID=311182 RepID=A0A6S6Y651_9PROT|nr:16S rRNA (guanine(527)-N(7))-methyltransferase RsmG [Denitratisoma oestradiolicum]TWO80719.1 16S rRNA (guanine(527)-N(7))-methyltransferase RsmG [Denitratisoma oestradiolicum]CAB1370980.1 methyltransferase, SAM-dependent methyltransferase, glucose-inhibited cell-division protein [Denitratisoma oestradiolicum]
MTPAETLHQGLAALSLGLPAEAEPRLLAYLELLKKWNRAYNLTAIRDEGEMITHHLLDSLSLAPYLTEVHNLADIGSGAGLPGIPLAIARPGLAITSVETVQKKAAFQQQARIELKLENFTMHCGRVERFEGQFEAVTSRAFAELADFARLAGHLVAEGGRLLAMKGLFPEAEIARLPAPWRMTESYPLLVPGLKAERHLIVLERS